MHHIAIMKKDWGLTQKILSGEKVIETRWYKVKAKPWDKINKDDTIFFKDSGSPITVKATVSNVEQFSDLTPFKINNLLTKYSSKDLGTSEIPKKIKEYVSGKRYAIIIHLQNPQKIKPFNINKSGYGSQASWIVTEDVEKLRLNK